MGLVHTIYGGISYVIFLVSFLYSIAFVGDFIVPRTVNAPASAVTWYAWFINALVLGLFAIQHSVMARPGFKRVWTRVVSPAIERSTYVLFSSLLLCLVFVLWQPIPSVVWDMRGTGVASLLWITFWLGWGDQVPMLIPFLKRGGGVAAARKGDERDFIAGSGR
jgi:methanethiol S-methyltransferase